MPATTWWVFWIIRYDRKSVQPEGRFAWILCFTQKLVKIVQQQQLHSNALTSKRMAPAQKLKVQCAMNLVFASQEKKFTSMGWSYVLRSQMFSVCAWGCANFSETLRRITSCKNIRSYLVMTNAILFLNKFHYDAGQITDGIRRTPWLVLFDLIKSSKVILTPKKTIISNRFLHCLPLHFWESWFNLEKYTREISVSASICILRNHVEFPDVSSYHKQQKKGHK